MHWRQYIARYGKASLPGEPWMRSTFLILLALAAVLRFWNLPELAYTHDELSALVRIYPSLGETISTGVAELDTHPPGVQVFEWVWTKVFGRNEADVKLPFIVMSLLAMLLLYRFALAWTGPAPALLLTALLGTLQYSVLYGQIARPYSAGLFTTALLADQLTRYLAFNNKKALVGAAFAMVLSAYTHHFALMLAALMAATGMMMVARDQRKAYLMACGIAAFLYLPNLPIFIIQLGLGGLSEWLAPPTGTWVLEHLWWVAHGSWALAGLLGLLAVLSVFGRLKDRNGADPANWFLPLWGLLPMAIGLGYSIWRAPVIQHSVLLFSFPYLALLVLGGLRRLPRFWTKGITGVLAFTAVMTLVNERRHFDLMYASKYEAFVKNGARAASELGQAEVAVLMDAPDHMVRFYTEHLAISQEQLPMVQLQGLGDDQLDSLLRNWQGQYVFLGQSNGAVPERTARVQTHFPYLIKRRDMNEGQWALFSKVPGYLTMDDRSVLAEASPSTRWPSGWDVHTDIPVVERDSGVFSWDLTGREFGVAFEALFDTLVTHPQQQIEVVTDVWSPAPVRDAGLIAHLFVGDSTVFYRGGDVAGLLPGQRSASIVVATRLGDAGKVKGPVRLKTYIHVRDRGPLFVDRITIRVRRENPVQFGLVEPFAGLGRFPVK